MDYISHHALHSHIPIHHYTNHTAVTIHSLTLIVSTHLHLIHTHTYKQHTSLHSPQSLVLHRLTFWAFPLFSPGLPIYSDRLLPAFWPCLPLDILSVCHLPRPLHCPCCWFCLAFITPVTTFDHCLSDHLLSINKAAIGTNYTASSLHYGVGLLFTFFPLQICLVQHSICTVYRYTWAVIYRCISIN